MVGSVTSLTRSGLKDWFLQRVSAVVLAVYMLFLVGFFAVHPQLDFASWKALFSSSWMRVFTLLAMFSLVMHAWVGVWTIFTDYIKCSVLRGILQAALMIVLVVYFIWAIQIIWGM